MKISEITSSKIELKRCGDLTDCLEKFWYHPKTDTTIGFNSRWDDHVHALKDYPEIFGIAPNNQHIIDRSWSYELMKSAMLNGWVRGIDSHGVLFLQAASLSFAARTAKAIQDAGAHIGEIIIDIGYWMEDAGHYNGATDPNKSYNLTDEQSIQKFIKYSRI
jgi:hypothetical protein